VGLTVKSLFTNKKMNTNKSVLILLISISFCGSCTPKTPFLTSDLIMLKESSSKGRILVSQIPPNDNDNDGVTNGSDTCSDSIENHNGINDGDGCLDRIKLRYYQFVIKTPWRCHKFAIDREVYQFYFSIDNQEAVRYEPPSGGQGSGHLFSPTGSVIFNQVSPDNPLEKIINSKTIALSDNALNTGKVLLSGIVYEYDRVFSRRKAAQFNKEYPINIIGKENKVYPFKEYSGKDVEFKNYSNYYSEYVGKKYLVIEDNSYCGITVILEVVQ
jgi:hypothetical protein